MPHHLLLPVTLLAAVASVVATAANAQAPPTVVRAAVAELREVQNHQRVTGSLRAVARGEVSALEEGRVVEIAPREGASVHKGEVIARIDARRLEAQRSELTASLRASEAQVKLRTLRLEQARRDLKRSQQLVATRAITVEEHQHNETDSAVAEAQLSTDERRVKEVQSQLDLLAVRLEDMVVRAPYDGRVVERHTEPGEWIHPGDPLVTLVSSGCIEAWLDVPERFAQTLDQQQVSVRAAGLDEVIVSEGAKAVPDVDSRTRTFPLVLTLDDHEGRLAPGMSVEAWLPVGAKERRLAVPKDAVIRSGHSSYVYKAVDQGGATVAVRAPIVIAFETGKAVMLAGGDLAEGDQVVVEGNERLMPGSPITLATPSGDGSAGETRYASRER